MLKNAKKNMYGLSFLTSQTKKKPRNQVNFIVFFLFGGNVLGTIIYKICVKKVIQMIVIS